MQEKTRVVLGVCASISAYKAPILVREMIKQGMEVRVVMTPSAHQFVSPLVLENLSRQAVACAMFDASTDGSWHIGLARWCQAMLIAPCSASTLARLAHGQSDTALALVALALPRTTPLILAPAMDSDMWLHPATQRNLDRLRQDGARIIEPEYGELASGLIGTGRLPEPATLIQALLDLNHRPLLGRTVLITAGPTREKIDDVRYLSNHSSGKMGYALAERAARLGAHVILVSGPVALQAPDHVEFRSVISAQEMFEVVLAERERADIFIMAAAVADFRPAHPVAGKIKKQASTTDLDIKLEKTRDILAEVGRCKRPDQFVVGFALEAADYLENARKKLREKNCDLVVLNAANRVDSGFAGDRNTITLVREGEEESFPALSKAECADVILARVIRSI